MSFPSIFLYMKYSIHPTYKQTLLLYSTIFRRWKSWAYKAKLYFKINSSRKFHSKRFLHDEFHPFNISSMSTWQNIFPCQNIFYPHQLILYLTWQKKFQEYPFHVIKRFFKRFYHAHLLIFIRSHSHTHKIMSLQPN